MACMSSIVLSIVNPSLTRFLSCAVTPLLLHMLLFNLFTMILMLKNYTLAQNKWKDLSDKWRDFKVKRSIELSTLLITFDRERFIGFDAITNIFIHFIAL